MKNKIQKILCGCWALNIVALLVIILIPKDNNIYNRLFVFFMLLIFLFPFILIAVQAGYRLKNKEPINTWSILPNIGCILIIGLTFVKFIGTIEKIALFEMIVITLTFILLEGLLMYILLRFKEMSKKQYIWLNIGIYGILALYFFCAMIMSVDYSIIW